MSKVSFDVTEDEAEIIEKIAARAVKGAAKHGIKLDQVSTEMDVTATHANGCPLRLQELLEADEFNFSHDIVGITNNIDRTTGK